MTCPGVPLRMVTAMLARVSVTLGPGIPELLGKSFKCLGRRLKPYVWTSMCRECLSKPRCFRRFSFLSSTISSEGKTPYDAKV